MFQAGMPKALHLRIFRRFVPLHYYAGNYRADDALQPCLRTQVHVGRVFGAPFQNVEREMSVLIQRLSVTLVETELGWSQLNSRERTLRVANLIATFVGAFIRIHTFVNGNGRISRLLWAWGLLRFGSPHQCRIHPRPDQPYAAIMGESMRGNDGPLALLILQHLAMHAPRIR
jgi:hypothetical protein